MVPVPNVALGFIARSLVLIFDRQRLDDQPRPNSAMLSSLGSGLVSVISGSLVVVDQHVHARRPSSATSAYSCRRVYPGCSLYVRNASHCKARRPGVHRHFKVSATVPRTPLRDDPDQLLVNFDNLPALLPILPGYSFPRPPSAMVNFDNFPSIRSRAAFTSP